MAWENYFTRAVDMLRGMAASQKDNLNAAADWLVSAIAQGRSVFSFGASHSFMMTEEMVYRTGGLMVINPIYPHGMNLSVRPLTLTSKVERIPGLGRELLDSSPIQAGDVLILASTSGRNAVVIDMALRAKERGIPVLGITSLDYSRSVTSRHESGKKLMDLCDVVLDNGAPAGDSAVEIAGFPQRVGPLSTIGGCALVNALSVAVVEGLLARGIEPPVFISANVDGGEESNSVLLEKNRARIHYM